MSEPTIICPNCKTEIKLTESLAAPLIESTRLQYERRLAQKDADFAKREASLHEREEALSKERESINDQVAEKLRQERISIAAEEAKKAKLVLADDIDRKTKEIADLQEVLKQRDTKLAAAQNAQAELIKKQREQDDAKRELELTVQKRINVSRPVRAATVIGSRYPIYRPHSTLRQLIKAGSAGDVGTFKQALEAVIREERQKQHHLLANDLEKILSYNEVGG